jgi:hypothetical protein
MYLRLPSGSTYRFQSSPCKHRGGGLRLRHGWSLADKKASFLRGNGLAGQPGPVGCDMGGGR